MAEAVDTQIMRFSLSLSYLIVVICYPFCGLHLLFIRVAALDKRKDAFRRLPTAALLRQPVERDTSPKF